MANLSHSEISFEQLRGKRLLAIDYGKKRTGTALYHVGLDPFPTPYQLLAIESRPKLISSLLHIIEEENVDHLVLGYPAYLSGQQSAMSKKVLTFKKGLETRFTQGKIFLQDEALTSHEAESRMKEDPRYNFKVDKQRLDSLAAVIILEDFIAQLKRNALN